MLTSNVTQYYISHDKDRIHQGDILKDVEIKIYEQGKLFNISCPYLVILSQDCDLEQCKGNKIENGINKQYLPNIIAIPAFVDEILRSGNHLEELFKITQEKIDTNRFKIIKRNDNPRYHYLNSCYDIGLPNLILDFKIYYTIPYWELKKQYDKAYLTTINELFRERTSQRFCNYLSRIGLPEIKSEILQETNPLPI